jgi:hypothetical protein
MPPPYIMSCLMQAYLRRHVCPDPMKHHGRHGSFSLGHACNNHSHGNFRHNPPPVGQNYTTYYFRRISGLFEVMRGNASGIASYIRMNQSCLLLV